MRLKAPIAAMAGVGAVLCGMVVDGDQERALSHDTLAEALHFMSARVAVPR